MNQETEREQVQKLDFSGIHLHIAMPCYAGQVSEPTMSSLFKFILLSNGLGLNWSFDSISNESLVTRARCNLMSKMMANKDATHFMFIDSDIRFDPKAIFLMIAANKEVIGGLYPKKGYPIGYSANLNEETEVEGSLFTVDTIGNGFLMMQRHVYERLCDAHPETKYIDDVYYGKEYEPYMYAIFDTQIDHNRHYLSEDWTFCRRWRRLGGKIWAHGDVLLNHTGFHEFEGDLSKLPQFAQPNGDTSDIENIEDLPASLINTLKMSRPPKLQGETDE